MRPRGALEVLWPGHPSFDGRRAGAGRVRWGGLGQIQEWCRPWRGRGAGQRHDAELAYDRTPGNGTLLTARSWSEPSTGALPAPALTEPGGWSAIPPAPDHR